MMKGREYSLAFKDLVRERWDVFRERFSVDVATEVGSKRWFLTAKGAEFRAEVAERVLAGNPPGT
jgi:hypothetical protein